MFNSPRSLWKLDGRVMAYHWQSCIHWLFHSTKRLWSKRRGDPQKRKEHMRSLCSIRWCTKKTNWANFSCRIFSVWAKSEFRRMLGLAQLENMSRSTSPMRDWTPKIVFIQRSKVDFVSRENHKKNYQWPVCWDLRVFGPARMSTVLCTTITQTMRWGYPTRCAQTASLCTSPGGTFTTILIMMVVVFVVFRSGMSDLLATHSFENLGASDFLLVLMSCIWAALPAGRFFSFLSILYCIALIQASMSRCHRNLRSLQEKMVTSGCKIVGIIRRCRVSGGKCVFNNLQWDCPQQKSFVPDRSLLRTTGVTSLGPKASEKPLLTPLHTTLAAILPRFFFNPGTTREQYDMGFLCQDPRLKCREAAGFLPRNGNSNDK